MDAKEGFSILNANNIEFHQVTINTKIGSSLKADNVKNLEINGFKTNKPLANSPVISLKNTSNVFIHNSWPKAGSPSFVDISGSKSSDITIKNNNFKAIKNPVKQSSEVKEKIMFD